MVRCCSGPELEPALEPELEPKLAEEPSPAGPTRCVQAPSLRDHRESSLETTQHTAGSFFSCIETKYETNVYF